MSFTDCFVGFVVDFFRPFSSLLASGEDFYPSNEIKRPSISLRDTLREKNKMGGLRNRINHSVSWD
jgi:hypothetical protein